MSLFEIKWRNSLELAVSNLMNLVRILARCQRTGLFNLMLSALILVHLDAFQLGLLYTAIISIECVLDWW